MAKRDDDTRPSTIEPIADIAMGSHPTVREDDDTTKVAAILQGLEAGDTAALGKLYRLHRNTVVRTLRKFGVRAADIEDVMHDIFIRAADWPPAAPHLVGFWLKGLARWRAADWRRQQATCGASVTPSSSDAPQDFPAPEPEADAPQAFELRTLLRSLYNFVETLSSTKRVVFALVIEEGLPGADVARYLGVSEAAVRKATHDVRISLRQATGKDPVLRAIAKDLNINLEIKPSGKK